MATTNFNFNLTLDNQEFIKVGDELYTTRQNLTHKEPRIHLIGNFCLRALKPFEGRLTKAVIKEWLLLAKVLDATCDSMNKWDEKKIIEELIAGHTHPISWYIENCQIPNK
jgi:hypothetical protein